MKKRTPLFILIGFIIVLPAFLNLNYIPTVYAQTGTWNFLSSPIQLTKWAYHIYHPDLAVDKDGFIHICYTTNDSHNIETWYADNVGNKFGNITKYMKPDDDIYQNYYGCRIAVDSNGNSHLIWEESASGKTYLYYKRYVDGAWSSPPITIAYGSLDYPDIAVSKADYVWVVFNNLSGIYAVWVSPTNLVYYKIPNTDGTEHHPRIACYNYPHIVYDKGSGSTREIYYTKKQSVGGFSNPIMITTNTSFECSRPDIAVDSSETPHIVYQYDWTGAVSGSFEIFYIPDINNASLHEYITYDTFNQTKPSIAVGSSGVIFVAYENDTGGGNENIYLKIKTSLDTWQTILNNSYVLTTNVFSDLCPMVDVDPDNNVHIIWYGYDGSTFNVFYNRGIYTPPTTVSPIPGFEILFVILMIGVCMIYHYKKNKQFLIV
ncbi:MAG: hypothetical protein ACTSPQ_18135 [Candidatus Helarchaeota archaeon]